MITLQKQYFWWFININHAMMLQAPPAPPAPGQEAPPPPPAGGAPSPVPEEPPAAANPVSKDPRYAKFFKMLQFVRGYMLLMFQ